MSHPLEWVVPALLCLALIATGLAVCHAALRGAGKDAASRARFAMHVSHTDGPVR